MSEQPRSKRLKNINFMEHKQTPNTHEGLNEGKIINFYSSANLLILRRI